MSTKKYLGVKIIQAEPMSANEFATIFPLKGKIDPGEDAPGYKVVYPDGYTSWSPKDVFEKAYQVLNIENAVNIAVDLNSGNWQFLRDEQTECDCER